MPLPSGDTITLNSGSITLRGNKTFSISMTLQDEAGGTDFSTSYTMTLSDIGGYEIDIDVPEDDDDVNALFYNVGEYDFSFWSVLGDGTDFGAILEQLTLANLVQIDVTYDGGTDSFLCQKPDFSYNRLKREVRVKAYSPFKYGEQISTFSTAGLTSPVVYKYPAGNPDTSQYSYNAITVNAAIGAYLDTFGSGVTKRVQSSFTDTTLSDNTGTPEGVSCYVDAENASDVTNVEGVGNAFVLDSFSVARQRILELGLLEGAIVGNLFGEAFYVRRDYNGTGDANYYTDITASDLEELNIEFYSSAVKSITMSMDVSRDQTLSPSEYPSDQSETIDSNKPQTINVSFPLPIKQFSFTNGGGDSGEDLIQDPADSEDGEVGLETLLASVKDTYKNVLGAEDSVRVSGVILGVDKIKPYEFAQFNTSINDYITSNNNKIRFSKLTYDFKEDKIEFEGYSIN